MPSLDSCTKAPKTSHDVSISVLRFTQPILCIVFHAHVLRNYRVLDRVARDAGSSLARPIIFTEM